MEREKKRERSAPQIVLFFFFFFFSLLFNELRSVRELTIILPPPPSFPKTTKFFKQSTCFSPSQRAAILQFTACTRCPEKLAVKFLTKSSWNVEIAVDSYFSHNSPSISHTPAANVSSINKVFDTYRDWSDPPNTIMVSGTMRYLGALGLDLEEVTVLALMEALKAPTMGELAREGFVEGWSAMGCDTIEKMRAGIPDLRNQISSDEALYKRVYLFTYAFARSPNQKSLPLDTAIEYWKLLLEKRFSKHIDLWVEFLTTKYNKSIAKDTWNMLYDFVQYCHQDPTLENYDEEGAWPSILDSFVGYVRDKNQTAMDTS